MGRHTLHVEAALTLLTFLIPSSVFSQSSKFREVVVAGVVSDTVFDSPVVVLYCDSVKTYLPIWIGSSEALAIQIELAGEKARRPLTADLMTTVISRLGATLTRVDITEVKDETYHAMLVLRRSDRTVEEIDARPSDAIGLALRWKAPIYVEKSILEKFGVNTRNALQTAREKIRKS